MAVFPTIRLANKTAPALFDPRKFRAMIENYGGDATWEQAAACPCGAFATLDGVTLRVARELQGECPACGGKGILYHSAQTIRLALARANKDNGLHERWGEWSWAYVDVSFPPENLLGFQDRITPVDSVILFREVAIREEEGPITLRYPAVQREFYVGSGADFRTPLKVTRATTGLWIADLAGTVSLSTRVEGVDYVINEQGNVDFSLGDANGRAPEMGAQFSVSYFARPSYIITNTPYVNRARNSFHVNQVGDKSILGKTEMPGNADAKLEFVGQWPGQVIS